MQLNHPKTYSLLQRKTTWNFNLSVIITLTLLLALFPSPVFAGGNDLMTGELRVDLPEVNLAKDYIESIEVGGLPSNGTNLDFTTGWIGINLDPPLTVFEQVGFKTNKFGVFWFVEEYNAGITCFHGTLITYSPTHATCQGDYSDRATIGNFQKVELVTYNQGFWIARVSDQFNNPLDVAQITYSSPTNAIYRANATTEEGYTESTDQYMVGLFWHNHPQYFIGGTGNPFADWPASSGGHNNPLSAYPTAICPKHYYGKFNWQGDPRVWYAGSKTQGSGVCTGNIF